MSRNGSMRGVHIDNETAETATRQRRAALREDAALGRAYSRDKRLCLHVPYAKFRNIVRTLARANNISVAAAATAWITRWSLQADRQATKLARDSKKAVRTLPDGRRVFYGS